MRDINQILRADPVSARYGAPRGARDNWDPAAPCLWVQPLRMVDGDYDESGTYWGASDESVYCGFNESTRVYVRARSRADAMSAILETYPDATFETGADIGAIVAGFIDGMVWAESGDDEAPLGDNADASMLAKSTESACRKIVESFAHYCADKGYSLEGIDPHRVGVDLWLTQRGHGAGFWDRGRAPIWRQLTEAAETVSAECYIGGDGLIYLEGYESHGEGAAS